MCSVSSSTTAVIVAAPTFHCCAFVMRALLHSGRLLFHYEERETGRDRTARHGRGAETRIGQHRRPATDPDRVLTGARRQHVDLETRTGAHRAVVIARTARIDFAAFPDVDPLR